MATTDAYVGNKGSVTVSSAGWGTAIAAVVTANAHKWTARIITGERKDITSFSSAGQRQFTSGNRHIEFTIHVLADDDVNMITSALLVTPVDCTVTLTANTGITAQFTGVLESVEADVDGMTADPVVYIYSGVSSGVVTMAP